MSCDGIISGTSKCRGLFGGAHVVAMGDAAACEWNEQDGVIRLSFLYLSGLYPVQGHAKLECFVSESQRIATWISMTMRCKCDLIIFDSYTLKFGCILWIVTIRIFI